MPRDYYEVLGVARSASTEEIAKAYKKLARKNHPDRNPGDKEAEARFKEIQNAYDILSDAQKRSQYDQYGFEVPTMGGPGPGGGFHFGGPGGTTNVDPEMTQRIFEQMFGGQGGAGIDPNDILGAFGGGSRKRGRSRRPAPVEHVEVEASVPFMIAATGGTISLQTGANVIEVKVPAGIEDGKKLRVSGQGPGGGDIMVQIKVEPHAYFRREGKTVLLEVPISVGEAILGGKVEVPTIDGKRVEVKIRPGTSSGSKTRLPGFGIAGGDQFLVFKIVVPKGEPDGTTKHLIEQYQHHQPSNPRADVAWKS